MCVRYLCGLESGISLSFKLLGGSWEHKSSDKTHCHGVCRLTLMITNSVFRLMSTSNIETYEFFPLLLYNNLSERSRSNPKPDSFRLGGESLCGVNLTSLPHMGFNSRIDFRCETNSPKTLRRASSTPSYSPRGWPRGMKRTPNSTVSGSVGEPSLGSTLILNVIRVYRRLKQGLRCIPPTHSDVWLSPNTILERVPREICQEHKVGQSEIRWWDRVNPKP